MPPTIIYKKASNWVDRGESALPTMQRVLAHFFERLGDDDRAWLENVALTVWGMVEADATEVHVASYLRSLQTDPHDESHPAPNTRLTAIALWHIAKSALVRDFAERVLSGDVPPNVPTPEPLSEWLEQRLLAREESTGEPRPSNDEKE